MPRSRSKSRRSLREDEEEEGAPTAAAPPPPPEEDEDEDEYESSSEDDGRGRRGKRKRRGGDVEDGRDGGGGGRRRRRSRRVRIMEQSGQTDEQRRDLRRAQRELQREIATGKAGDDMEDPDKGAFETIRDKNNELWGKVCYTREAVLDGDNLELITARAARQADRLAQLQAPRYDAARFSQKLRAKLTSRSGSLSYLDWRRLGTEAGSCFNAVPSRVAFLHGPLDVVYAPKERKRAERRGRRTAAEEEEGEEERPDEVEQRREDRSGDKLSAVERNIIVVQGKLKERCEAEYVAAAERVKGAVAAGRYGESEEEKKRAYKRAKRHGAEVDAVKCLFNPKSFTQTVENIFHFSFLVKKGSAGIGVRTEDESKELGGAGPGPVVRVTGGREPPPPRQAIVSLTMQDWRDMCEAYEVEESDIPHRKGSRHARQSQSAAS